MIVVAIIGVLAAVAIPAYSGYVKKAKVSEVTNAMGAVGGAVVEAFQATGNYVSIDTETGAASLTAIEDSLGITIPDTYVETCTITGTATDAEIQVEFNDQIDDAWDGFVLTLQVAQGTRGSWNPNSSDTLPSAFIPKSN